jgi:hypothetical protein
MTGSLEAQWQHHPSSFSKVSSINFCCFYEWLRHKRKLFYRTIFWLNIWQLLGDKERERGGGGCRFHRSTSLKGVIHNNGALMLFNASISIYKRMFASNTSMYAIPILRSLYFMFLYWLKRQSVCEYHLSPISTLTVLYLTTINHSDHFMSDITNSNTIYFNFKIIIVFPQNLYKLILKHCGTKISN